MSRTFFTEAVTHVPAAWANDVDDLVYVVFEAAKTIPQVRERLGMKSLAQQAADAVAITGGAIDGVTAGVKTPLAQLVATSAQVANAPLNDQDVVNFTALKSYVESALRGGAKAFTGGLGSIARQNHNNVSLTGGTLNGVDIGLKNAASGRFTNLKITNPPTDADDAVTLGWLAAHYDLKLNAIRSMGRQDADAVQITGGSADGLDIGLNSPAKARFLTATVITAPKNNEDLTNKRYVDSSVAAFRAELGSLAFQRSDKVAITGGAINGVVIGATLPSTARFTDITLIDNDPTLTLRTSSTGANNRARVVFQDGATVIGSLSYIGASNAERPNTMDLTSSVPLSIRTTDTWMGLNNGTLTLSAKAVRIGDTDQTRTIIGSGEAEPNMRNTMRGESFADRLTTPRLVVRDTWTRELNGVYANGVTGVATVDINSSPIYQMLVTGDIQIKTTAPNLDRWSNAGWTEMEVLLLFPSGGKVVTWPTNISFGSGRYPDYSKLPAGFWDIVTLRSIDGINWIASCAYAALQHAPAPMVTFFAVTTSTGTVLKWTVRNAVRVHITNIGLVEATTGQVNVANTALDYVMTAYGVDGQETTVTVHVNPI